MSTSMATRQIVSYDDIASPYIPPAVSDRPPPKKRKRNHQRTKQAHTHASGPAISNLKVAELRHQDTSTADDEVAGYNDEESRELTHEEIWDDSALLDAWEAAQQEYESYHGTGKDWKNEPVKKSPL